MIVYAICCSVFFQGCHEPYAHTHPLSYDNATTILPVIMREMEQKRDKDSNSDINKDK